jgi:hypothetical protein
MGQRLRDHDERWQRLSQQGVQLFIGLVMAQKMPFAFETVFSHWKRKQDGTVESKADVILQLKEIGYFVVAIGQYLVATCRARSSAEEYVSAALCVGGECENISRQEARTAWPSNQLRAVRRARTLRAS